MGLNAAHITDSSHTAQQSQQSGLSVGITYGPVKAAKSAYDKSMAGSQNSGSAVGKWFAHDIAILESQPGRHVANRNHRRAQPLKRR